MYIKIYRFRLYITIRLSSTKHARGYGITRNGHGKRAHQRADQDRQLWAAIAHAIKPVGV